MQHGIIIYGYVNVIWSNSRFENKAVVIDLCKRSIIPICWHPFVFSNKQSSKSKLRAGKCFNNGL